MDAETRAVMLRLVEALTYRMPCDHKRTRAPSSPTEDVTCKDCGAKDYLGMAFSQQRSYVKTLCALITAARNLLDAQPAGKYAWVAEAERLSDVYANSCSGHNDENPYSAFQALKTHLRSHPAAPGFFAIPIKPTTVQWDAAWLKLQTEKKFTNIRAKLSAHDVLLIFTMLHEVFIAAAEKE